MWHNVIFKASFERVQKEGPGPHATYHMAEEMGYMPPEEGVKHVNDNVTLLVEKQLTAPEFSNLLHEISKFVQEDPGPWKNKPKSLLYTASFVSAQNLTVEQTKQLPQILVEETACHLPAHELVDFIKLNKYMYGLRDFFTPNGLQKLLLHFYKTYQRPDLHPETKKQMKRVKKTLKWGVFATTRKEVARNVKFNWVLASLGLFKQLDQFDARFHLEYRFYALKFRYEKQSIRFPIPEINFTLCRIVPLLEDIPGDVAELDQPHVKYRDEFVPPSELKEKFFSYLCGMQESMWRGSWHEVLAYGAHILCHRNWSDIEDLQKYFLHVWGNLAVSLAKLHIPVYYTLSCLYKIVPLSYAFEIDLKHYKQQVLGAYGQYEKEKEIFTELMQIVPTYSKFFRQIIIAHMSATEKRVEDMLMDLIGGYAQLDHQRNAAMETEMMRIQKAIKKICNEHIKLMHVVCANSKSEIHIQDYELQIALMMLYKQMMVCIETEGETEEDFYPIMRRINTHLEYTWNYLIELDSYETYEREMDDLKSELQLQTRMAYPKSWADVCYLHLIFSKALRDFQPANFLTWLYEDALEIYTKLDHPRAHRLKKQYKNGPGALPRRQFNTTCYSQCTIVWLTQNAPRVKGLIRSGVTSLKRFDVEERAGYWQGLN